VGVDHFRVGSCAGNCAQLNTRDGLDPAGCHAWQCDVTGQFCELPTIVDRDHDGFSPIACGGTDCNDEDRGSAQGAAESCDGIDNDCNGIVDDVRTGTPLDPVTVLADAATPTFVSYGAATDGVVVGWRSGASTQLGLVDHVESASSSHALSGSANAMPEQALTSAAAGMGCPQPEIHSLIPTCGAAGACTVAGWHCVMPSTGPDVCEAPVTNHSPLHPMECTTHAECQDGLACNGREICDPTGNPIGLDARGCRSAASTMPCTSAAACDELHDTCIVPMLGPCTFGDLALDSFAATEWMTLAVTTDGCTSGRVRTGVVDATQPTSSVLFWGDHRLSTTWAGVDLDDMGCTGASRAASDVAGAAGVSIASLATDPLHDRPVPQALAAWRAAPVCSGVGGCAAMTPASASIEVLGLWRERGTSNGTPIRWVDGSDDGTPVRLMDAAASARPNVTSWTLVSGAAGYAIAYARAGGGVAISLVHAFTSTTAMPLAPRCDTTPTPPVCLVPQAGADAIIGSADDGDSLTQIAMPGTSRTTPSLGAPIPETIAASEVVVGDVSITTGARMAGATTVPLVLAWATATEVVLAHATFDPATNMLTEGALMRFASRGATDVSVVHLSAGLVEATARPLGGLVVTWSTSLGTFAVRVADDGDAVMMPGVVRLGDPSDHPRAFLDQIPAAGSTPATTRARVIAHRGDSFIAFPAICGSAP